MSLWWGSSRARGGQQVSLDTALRHQILSLYGGSSLTRLYAWAKLFLLPFEQLALYVPKSASVLDIGCGFGYVANFLSLQDPSRTVTGVDPSATRIEAARQTVDGRRNIEFLALDSRELHRDGFDAIVMTDVLHHTPFDQHALIVRDVYAKLRPGGSFVIRETAKSFRLRYFLFNELLERALYVGQEKAKFRPASEWKDMLEGAGFTILDEIPNGPLFPYVTVLFACVKPEQSQPRS